MTSRRARSLAFLAVVGVAVVVAGVSIWRARHAGGPATASTVDATQRLDAPPARPFIAVRDLTAGTAWGHVALAPLDTPGGPRHVTALECDRVYFAGGRGVCLQADGLAGRALLFDDHQQVRATLPLSGPPSRARVSRDGHWGAFTVFEQGHSYADDTFSTRTTIVDMTSGTPLPDLESFAVWQDGARVTRPDVNYWGVTFAPDGRHFYATLAFGGTPYLVEGDLVDRLVRVIAAQVECPSLSPDGRRVAFKRAHGLRWRLWVRDLASGVEHIVAGETRSIDDQAEWLDDARLLYQFPSDEGNVVYVADVDGDTPARVFMRDAWSPSVVR
ncbi:MAG: hypothetical protein U0P30_00420 [Vicinamibacterales bacterium]